MLQHCQWKNCARRWLPTGCLCATQGACEPQTLGAVFYIDSVRSIWGRFDILEKLRKSESADFLLLEYLFHSIMTSKYIMYSKPLGIKFQIHHQIDVSLHTEFYLPLIQQGKTFVTWRNALGMSHHVFFMLNIPSHAVATVHKWTKMQIRSLHKWIGLSDTYFYLWQFSHGMLLLRFILEVNFKRFKMQASVDFDFVFLGIARICLKYQGGQNLLPLRSCQVFHANFMNNIGLITCVLLGQYKNKT